MVLTDEQKKRIEENRLRAIAKRQSQQSTTASTAFKPLTATTQSSSLSGSKLTSSHAGSVVTKPNFAPKELPHFSKGTSSQTSTGPKSFAKEESSKTSINQPCKPTSFAGKTIKGQCILIACDQFKVDVPFHGAVIAIFKRMPTARYNAQDRSWSFNLSDHEELFRQVRTLRPEVDVVGLPSYVIKILRMKSLKNSEVHVNTGNDGSFQIEPSLWDALMPFQREGVLYALQRNGRVLLADDMGLGKTVQALSIALAYRKEWPLLIVCPSSMRFAWKTAILKWIPSIPNEDILVVTGGKDYLCNVQVVIINYDLLSKKQEELVSRNFRVIVFDECHFLKSHKSQRCKAADVIAKRSPRLVLLSGTPALSRPMELFSQISIIEPTLFPSAIEFGMRYCDGKKVSFGNKEHFDFQGSSNMPELKMILESRCMIRRMKADVISQLPSKQRQMVELDPTILGTRKEMQRQAKQMMSNNLSKTEKRGILLQWFHSTAEAKLKAVLEYVKDLLESGKKFICFAHHQVMINGIIDLLTKQRVGYVKIDGSTSAALREQSCVDFQTLDTKRVAVLSITAANAGLTLTATQLVIFAELFWNPGILIQAEDRAHRIGQTSSVTVQYLVAMGTADDELWRMLQKKMEVLSKVGLSHENFTDSDSTNIKQIAKTVPETPERKITDYFSTSLTEDDLNEIFEDDDFDMDSEPSVKRSKP